MSEIKRPLRRLAAGEHYTAPADEVAYVIEEQNTHNDILRYIIEDTSKGHLFVLADMVTSDGSTAKERVEVELEALQTKLSSLTTFLNRSDFETIIENEVQRHLLHSQLMAMQAYAYILQERLKIWA